MQNQTNPTKGYLQGWISIVFSIYLLGVAFTNLEYNRRSAEASEKIAKELNTINKSNFMNKLNNEINKEK